MVDNFVVRAPTTVLDFSDLTLLRRPLAVIHGESDELGPLAQVRELVEQAGETSKLFTVPGASHTFPGLAHLVETPLGEAAAFCLEQLGGESQ